MKKPKLSLNFGEGGFQGWLARHCEKMILGVVVFLALWVIWGGYGLSGLESGKSPEKLRATAQEKRANITATTWEQFKTENKDRVLPRIETQDVAVKVDSTHYPLPNRWNPPVSRKLQPRVDPVIFAPINLRPVPIVGSIAYHPNAGYEDQLEAASSQADPKSTARRPTARPGAKPAGRAARGRTRNPMGGSGPMGPMGDGMDPAMLGAEDGMPGAEMMDGMMPGDEMAPGAEMGMEMGMMGTTAGTQQATDFQPPPNSIAKTKYAVVLMALVQHEKQWEEYERALAESLDPDPRRDHPMYLTFFVQRVDVTDNPEVDPSTITDEQWAEVKVRPSDSLKDAAKWAGFPKDILDPNYLMPVNPYAAAGQQIGLTHPLPAFVQRDLWDAMTHPDIPLASAARQMPTQRAPAEEATEEEGDDIPGGGVPGGGVAAGRGAMMPGGAPGGDMADGMMPGMGGGGMGGGMMPGMGGGGMGGGMMPGMGGGGMGGGMMPGMGGGGMGGGMMPGMGGEMGGGMMPEMGGGMMGMEGGYMAATLPKYKLIRMTDLSVEPGRKYRYRVKVVVDDPNNPRLSQAPRPSALHEDVLARLKTDEGKLQYLTPKDWSAPSDVVSMPSAQWFYAGAVDNDAGQVLVDDTRPVRREPSAKAVAVKHDPTKSADIPTEQTVYRGSTLNLKADVNVIHPVKGDMRTLKDYELRTDAVVADILGGETIPLVNKDRSDKMTVPGELLIIDADGNLLVQDESEDIMEFRRYVRDDESSAPAPMDMGIPGAMDGMMPGADDSPGGPMGRSKRNR